MNSDLVARLRAIVDEVEAALDVPGPPPHISPLDVFQKELDDPSRVFVSLTGEHYVAKPIVISRSDLVVDMSEATLKAPPGMTGVLRLRSRLGPWMGVGAFVDARGFVSGTGLQFVSGTELDFSPGDVVVLELGVSYRDPAEPEAVVRATIQAYENGVFQFVDPLPEVRVWTDGELRNSSPPSEHYKIGNVGEVIPGPGGRIKRGYGSHQRIMKLVAPVDRVVVDMPKIEGGDVGVFVSHAEDIQLNGVASHDTKFAVRSQHSDVSVQRCWVSGEGNAAFDVWGGSLDARDVSVAGTGLDLAHIELGGVVHVDDVNYQVTDPVSVVINYHGMAEISNGAIEILGTKGQLSSFQPVIWRDVTANRPFRDKDIVINTPPARVVHAWWEVSADHVSRWDYTGDEYLRSVDPGRTMMEFAAEIHEDGAMCNLGGLTPKQPISRLWRTARQIAVLASMPAGGTRFHDFPVISNGYVVDAHYKNGLRLTSGGVVLAKLAFPWVEGVEYLIVVQYEDGKLRLAVFGGEVALASNPFLYDPTPTESTVCFGAASLSYRPCKLKIKRIVVSHAPVPLDELKRPYVPGRVEDRGPAVLLQGPQLKLTSKDQVFTSIYWYNQTDDGYEYFSTDHADSAGDAGIWYRRYGNAWKKLTIANGVQPETPLIVYDGLDGLWCLYYHDKDRGRNDFPFPESIQTTKVLTASTLEDLFGGRVAPLTVIPPFWSEGRMPSNVGGHTGYATVLPPFTLPRQASWCFFHNSTERWNWLTRSDSPVVALWNAQSILLDDTTFRADVVRFEWWRYQFVSERNKVYGVGPCFANGADGWPYAAVGLVELAWDDEGQYWKPPAMASVQILFTGSARKGIGRMQGVSARYSNGVLKVWPKMGFFKDIGWHADELLELTYRL
jgi:hypothetical protein